MNWGLLIGVALIIVFGGCSVQSIYVDYAEMSPGGKPRPARKVQIISEQPDREYTEIGLIEVRANSGDTMAAIMVEVQKVAGQRGADAVILRSSGMQNVGVMPMGSALVPINQRKIVATAITWK